jgi:hypothetical protein
LLDLGYRFEFTIHRRGAETRERIHMAITESFESPGKDQRLVDGSRVSNAAVTTPQSLDFDAFPPETAIRTAPRRLPPSRVTLTKAEQIAALDFPSEETIGPNIPPPSIKRSAPSPEPIAIAPIARSASQTQRLSVEHAPVPMVRTPIAEAQLNRRQLSLMVCAVGIAAAAAMMPRFVNVMRGVTTIDLPFGGAMPAVDESVAAPDLALAPLPAAPVADVHHVLIAATIFEPVAYRTSAVAQPPVSADPPFVPRGQTTRAARRQTTRAATPTPVSTYVGSLAVSSSPPRAQVFVNGVMVGVTPVVLQEMPVGSRALRVVLDGYTRWTSVVRIIAGERTVVSAKLQSSATP